MLRSQWTNNGDKWPWLHPVCSACAGPVYSILNTIKDLRAFAFEWILLLDWLVLGIYKINYWLFLETFSSSDGPSFIKTQVELSLGPALAASGSDKINICTISSSTANQDWEIPIKYRARAEQTNFFLDQVWIINYGCARVTTSEKGRNFQQL